MRNHSNRKFITIPVLLMILLLAPAGAQTWYYFQDSPDDSGYPYSWMELTPPSNLERTGNENRNFPVETTIIPRQGLNCLRLNWTSNPGGNWFAIAAGDNWTAKDISNADTLIFFLRSEVLLTKENLPYLFMEDVNNLKSTLHSLAQWAPDLQPGEWTAVKIPMQQLFDAADGVDWTEVKTIGFAQNTADETEHTIYIDDMRVVTGSTTAPVATPPTGVRAYGYDNHIEMKWDPNPETDLAGYRIERSDNGGGTYQAIAVVDTFPKIYIDWTAEKGTGFTATYRVRAINSANEPSEPSETAQATTAALTDEQLLDMVQEYTFRYFWDFGHPVSGLTRERNTSGDVVTTGGTGFGLMAIPVGIERQFISREEGAERVLKMLNFLDTADRFHGAWSHWMNGVTGDAIPFSTYDNGGDLVETAFLAQGLLTIRRYFSSSTETEMGIVSKATQLWEEIEWDWYRRNNSEVIYWHWSPDYEWQMNMQVRGWNEAAIVYLLAIASPTHGVPASMWESGWVQSDYYNPRTLFGHKLYVGQGHGGPMFFAHYSFLGFDPNDKADAYANYFDHNRNQALIQQAYCEANIYGYLGYSEESWGITASDDPDGYLAHEPRTDRDNGTISPTAALGSFPYTPEASMLALKHFYRDLGERTWDWMGFKDAFNHSRDWFADSYLAIDQGPIILMIENYRSQLLWNLFMSNPEIDPMLNAIGFTYKPNTIEEKSIRSGPVISPNPSPFGPVIEFELETSKNTRLEIYDRAGRLIRKFEPGSPMPAGINRIDVASFGLSDGLYLVRLTADGILICADKILINH